MLLVDMTWTGVRELFTTSHNEVNFKEDSNSFTNSFPGPKSGFTRSFPMATTDMLSVLATAPLEHSYFDNGKLGAWAGPIHCTLNPMRKDVVDWEEQKLRKNEEGVQLNYDMYEEKEDKEELQVMLTVSTKSMKLMDQTMKGWNRERSTLPGMPKGSR